MTIVRELRGPLFTSAGQLESIALRAAGEIESLTAERDRLWKALQWIASDLGPNVGVGAYWRQRTALIALGREWPEDAIIGEQ